MTDRHEERPSERALRDAIKGLRDYVQSAEQDATELANRLARERTEIAEALTEITELETALSTLGFKVTP